jgi:hypothetical protein
MHFWIYLFALPIAFLTAILIYFLLRDRSELVRISAWAAIVSGFAAPLFALWGLTHRNASQMPVAFEVGFEKKAWLVAVSAALLALAWLIQSRRRSSIAVLILSCLSVVFWSVVVFTF